MFGFIKKYLLGRLKEGSTWKGIISFVVGLVGWEITGGQTDAVAGLCVSIYTLLSVFFPDKFGETPEQSTSMQKNNSPDIPTETIKTNVPTKKWNGKVSGSFGSE